MKEFDALRQRYECVRDSQSGIEILKEDYLASPICREILLLMAAVPTVLHLGKEKKTFLFQDRKKKEGQLVAVSSDVSDEDLRKITVILLEYAGEYYDHQKFHQDVTGLTAGILLQFAIRKYKIPVNAYFDLESPDFYPMGASDAGN